MAAGSVSPELVTLLVSPRGPAFCRLLRRVYYEELQAGHITPHASADEAPLLETAIELGLLRAATGSGGLQMTPFGYEVSNVAKEYSNWLDAGGRLPDGVSEAMLAGKRVLDVGCGFGRHMLGFARAHGRPIGIELQDTYLQLSRVFAAHHEIPTPPVARARAEHLPFRSGAFDVVFCRLVINYVRHIDDTLAEFVRVLTPQGILVLTIDPLDVPVRTLLRSKWIGNMRTIAFTLFGLANTACLQTTGRQIVIRSRGRMHAAHSPAWPTSGWFERRLAAHGLRPAQGTATRIDGLRGVFVGRLV